MDYLLAWFACPAVNERRHARFPDIRGSLNFVFESARNCTAAKNCVNEKAGAFAGPRSEIKCSTFEGAD
jgi:hypothetical protein